MTVNTAPMELLRTEFIRILADLCLFGFGFAVGYHVTRKNKKNGKV